MDPAQEDARENRLLSPTGILNKQQADGLHLCKICSDAGLETDEMAEARWRERGKNIVAKGESRNLRLTLEQINFSIKAEAKHFLVFVGK